ncbi:tetratricopeptide repeat protein [Limibaculum sp. FT325]|uniref:tetratricopeptide repeat protein n=1 Tax=Thermohalobaculum sediminis TaxID=2939436 RepID=UPI0020BFFDA4|nr:tetratricopeptide repeat protein [Limibaculum sediminis]MCL5778652.1 tetratricopeptide repeat protein [Limibaculum sediminis]
MSYFDVDVYSRPITTASAEAQLWFDRGLVWTFGYHHEEAIECFRRALEHDPDCAMAHWGIAYAVGPNYNMEWRHFDPDGKAQALAAAFDETAAAMRLAGRVTPVERALIEALPARYPQRDPIEAQEPWNDAFADAMRDVYRAFPDDLEVATIFVEAILNRTPWRMWDLRTGGVAPGAGTAEAREVLERAMRDDPTAMRHAGILHLYVHLMEMSPFPELALRAGDVLRTLVPDAGHLVHMPTHIDILCGQYRDVLYWNQKGIEADRKYYDRHGALNFYSAYRIHNYHFAIYGAMFLGQYEPALAAAEELIETTPEELLRLPTPPMADFIESYISMKQHVFIRFGKWREIIAQELPEDRELYCMTTASMHYSKGVAHAALGEIEAAEQEKARFLAARERVPESRLLHNNTCLDLLAIAEEMLNGEIEYRKGNHDLAFAHLRRSVELDDNLPYDEPWGWIQPTRHALGALLFEQGRVEEAEAVYREDLGLGGALSRATIHPDNVWSLRGLHDCLARRGETIESRLIRQRLDIAAARADMPVRASCFCARAAAE